MRYIVSGMIIHGGKPVPWKETDDDEMTIIEKFKEDEWVWDCDGGGDDTYWFGFSTGKYFKLYHDFYANHGVDEEGEHTFEVRNYFELDEVTKEEAMPHLCSDRDWIYIHPTYRRSW